MLDKLAWGSITLVLVLQWTVFSYFLRIKKCDLDPPHVYLEYNSSLLQVQREYLALNRSSRSTLEAWKSTECRSFYSELAPASKEFLVLEDFYPGGRRYAIPESSGYQEVFISHKYRLAYVEVRKSASAAIRKQMERSLGGDWIQWCGKAQCVRRNGRCTTDCLTDEMRRSYFFFSFVRHPRDRFLHSLAQANEAWLTLEHADRVLGLLERSRVPNEHLETQSCSLSWFDQRPLPLVFIGRMEEEGSWKAFFSEANRYLKQWNLSLPITEFPTFSHASESLEQKRKTLEKELSNRNDLITRIDQVYAQDLACFSFDPADAKLQTPTQ